MRLIEADAKQILHRRGLAVPPHATVVRADRPGADLPPGPVAVKAQVLQGSRADAGLIELVPGDAAPAVQRIGAALQAAGAEPLVLVECQVPFTAEYYVAWRIDDLAQQPMLLFNRHGGTGVESRAADIATWLHPVLKELLPADLAGFLRGQDVPPAHIGPLARYCVSLYETFRQEDAVLLEINPLVITARGQAMALDAKMIVDDYAAPRHLEWQALHSARLQSAAADPLELAAERAGFTFVNLRGRVAVFSAGAGLGMCLTDVLADAGMPAANFADATGGAGVERWASMASIVFERARDPAVEAILVFFTLTATSLKSVVDGLVQVLDAGGAPKPLVAGFVCAAAAERDMTFEQAREVLRARGHTCVDDMRAAVQALQAVVKA